MKPSFVYFIRPIGADGPVKIGCSEAPEVRLSSMLTWSPLPLEIAAFAPGSLQDEGFIHSCFADDHSHREWFKPSAALTALVDAVKHSGTLEAAKGLKPIRSIRAGRTPAVWTDQMKRYISYNTRISHAERRLSKVSKTDWRAPDDVFSILYNWSHSNRNGDCSPPSSTAIARLDEFLADPAAHAVSVKRARTA